MDFKPYSARAEKHARTFFRALTLLLLLAFSPASSYADPVPANDSDTLTIALAPVVDMGVDVDTATARFSVSDAPGSLATSIQMGATAYLVSPATVTVLGNFNNQEIQLSAASLDSWSLDTDESAETDQVQLYALFAVDKASRPVEAEFGQGGDGRHLVKTSAAPAGEPSGSENNDLSDNRFEIADGGMTSGTNMDNLAVGSKKQLWLRVDAPPLTNSDEIQRIVVTLTAVNGRTN